MEKQKLDFSKLEDLKITNMVEYNIDTGESKELVTVVGKISYTFVSVPIIFYKGDDYLEAFRIFKKVNEVERK